MSKLFSLQDAVKRVEERHNSSPLPRFIPSISKRQKFVVAVVLLTLGLFFSENLFGNSGVFFSLFLSFVTELFLLWAMHKDIEDTNFTYNIFILPFFYSLAFGLFYFLVPQRLLIKIIITSLYGIGLYSLFLSQNIFTVASIRTIQLLSGARIVSFILTLVSFFFLSNIIFTLHLSLLPIAAIFFVFSFFLCLHSLWTYTLEPSFRGLFTWVFGLSVCLFEVSMVLWFWPTTPTFIALFLTGLFYLIVGLSHVWFDRRLFRSVMWEYAWVGFIVFFIFILSTNWRH